MSRGGSPSGSKVGQGCERVGGAQRNLDRDRGRRRLRRPSPRGGGSRGFRLPVAVSSETSTCPYRRHEEESLGAGENLEKPESAVFRAVLMARGDIRGDIRGETRCRIRQRGREPARPGECSLSLQSAAVREGAFSLSFRLAPKQASSDHIGCHVCCVHGAQPSWCRRHRIVLPPGIFFSHPAGIEGDTDESLGAAATL